VCGKFNYDESYVLVNDEPVKHKSLNHIQKHICNDCDDRPTGNKELQELRNELYKGKYPDVIKTKQLDNGMIVEEFPKEEDVKEEVVIVQGVSKDKLEKIPKRKKRNGRNK
jgi:hypothetical protein